MKGDGQEASEGHVYTQYSLLSIVEGRGETLHYRGLM